jgi:hypothetical protein
VASVTFNDGDCADLTVINVNFTDGGGYGISEGGAIDNEGGRSTWKAGPSPTTRPTGTAGPSTTTAR